MTVKGRLTSASGSSLVTRLRPPLLPWRRSDHSPRSMDLRKSRETFARFCFIIFYLLIISTSHTILFLKMVEIHLVYSFIFYISIENFILTKVFFYSGRSDAP